MFGWTINLPLRRVRKGSTVHASRVSTFTREPCTSSMSTAQTYNAVFPSGKTVPPNGEIDRRAGQARLPRRVQNIPRVTFGMNSLLRISASDRTEPLPCGARRLNAGKIGCSGGRREEASSGERGPVRPIASRPIDGPVVRVGKKGPTCTSSSLPCTMPGEAWGQNSRRLMGA